MDKIFRRDASWIPIYRRRIRKPPDVGVFNAAVAASMAVRATDDADKTMPQVGAASMALNAANDSAVLLLPQLVHGAQGIICERRSPKAHGVCGSRHISARAQTPERR